MDQLIKLIREDMRPSLGVTEPGAIALAVATAYAHISGEIVSVQVELNSGMYKNAFTCAIPGTSRTGSVYAAALGAVAGDPSLALESLRSITADDIASAESLIQQGRVQVHMRGISPDIFIKATVVTSSGQASAIIEHSHTHITQIICNGNVIKTGLKSDPHSAAPSLICNFTFKDFIECALTAPIDSLRFINDAFEMNLALLKAGLEDSRTQIAHHYYALNQNTLLSNNALTSAQLLSSGAIEARVLGIGLPAMSITGSGSHGIIATMPLYAYCHCNQLSPERLLRAAALSALVTQYIKEYSGKLSALCGCGIAAGAGAACGLALLQNANEEQLIATLNAMTLGITGMICDGGNHGCAIKSTIAVDAAFHAADWAMSGIAISPRHGICGNTPEETMRNIGLIASPGMLKTEEVIVSIMDNKT